MKIILIRHGKTVINELYDNGEAIYAGCINNYLGELSQEGREKAKKLASKTIFKEAKIIYSSPLKRAIATAKYACPNKDIIVDDLLKERSLGEFEGLKEAYLIEKYPKYFKDNSYKNFRLSYTIRTPQGENLTDVTNRCIKFINKLDLSSNKTIYIFTHSVFMKCFIIYLLKLDKESINTLKINNLDIITLEGTNLNNFRRL